MKVNLDLISESLTRPTELPARILKAVVDNHSHERDIGLRLFKLPVIPKGKRVVEYPATNPPDFAVRVHKEKGLDLYIGYFVYKDRNKWRIFQHVFNVDSRGRVQEHCDIEWDSSSYYLGMKVPKSDIPKRKFVMLFSRLNYILEHSPRALFDMPEPSTETDEE